MKIAIGIVIGFVLALGVPAGAHGSSYHGGALAWIAKEMKAIKIANQSATRAQWAQVYWLKKAAECER